MDIPVGLCVWLWRMIVSFMKLPKVIIIFIFNLISPIKFEPADPPQQYAPVNNYLPPIPPGVGPPAQAIHPPAQGNVFSFVRGCYYTSWAQYRAEPGKYTFDKYQPHLCTHIFYALAIMGNDFKIKMHDNNDATGYQQLQQLKVNQPNLKTLLSMGGSNFCEQNAALLKSMSSHANNRATFIFSTVNLLRQYGFDGFDLDWEYPDAQDKTNFAMLISEMREHFEREVVQSNKPRLLLTAAVSAGTQKIDDGYDGTQVGRSLDYLNIMTYDFHGGWDKHTGFNSPLFDYNGDRASISSAAQKWEAHGVPRNKILVGMATYGRGFTLANANIAGVGVGQPTIGVSPKQRYTGKAGYAAYYEICDLIDNKGFAKMYDDKQKAAVAVGHNQWYGFNDVQSFNEILDFVKQNQYGGVFVWTLDLDDFLGTCKSSQGQTYPLINAIRSKLG